jgi:UDP-N-acetylglucosamine kinase
MAIEGFSESEFHARFANTYNRIIQNKKPAARPHAYLTGGQSGAGKSILHEIAREEQGGNLIVLDGDSYRSLHPNYREINCKYKKDSALYTQKFAGRIVEALIEQLGNDGYHLLIEGTLRTVDVPKQTAISLREKGYAIDLLIMVVKPNLSYISTIQRYEKMLSLNPSIARSAPKEHHDLIVENLCGNLNTLYQERVFDAIRLYDRSKDILYNSDDTPETSPMDIAFNGMFGNWREDELEMLDCSIKDTLLLMKGRGAEGSEEWQQVNRIADRMQMMPDSK